MAQSFASHVQPLEQRFLLSATGFKGHHGRLDVTGSKGDDVIVVCKNGEDSSKLDVTINGQTTSFNLEGLRKVHLKGKRGDDVLRFDESNGTFDFKTMLKGQHGNDTLVGCSGDDKMIGGSGDDDMEGGEGDDKIRGNRGKDACAGGEGKDRIRGGRGRDFFNKFDKKKECIDKDKEENNVDLVLLDDVPPVVLDGLYSMYGMDIEVQSVEMKTIDDLTHYKFSMTAGQEKLQALFGPDGTLIEGSFSFFQLPDDAKNTFNTEFPDVTVCMVQRMVSTVEEVETVTFKVYFKTTEGDAGLALLGEDGSLLHSAIEDGDDASEGECEDDEDEECEEDEEDEDDDT